MQKFIIPLLGIFAASCAQNTQLPNNDCTAAIAAVCIPIYGRMADWDVISDDLARNIYRHNMMCAEINKKSRG